MRWAIVSGEYPPQRGGLADGTFLLCQALVAAGDDVHLFTRLPAQATPGVTCHALRGWRARWSEVPAPFQILVQFTPQAFGWRGANLGFGRWLRRQRAMKPWVIFHEVVYPREPGQSWKLRLLAALTRRLARDVRSAAARSLIAIPGWDPILQSLVSGAPNEWAPMWSNLPLSVAPAEAESARQRMLAGGGSRIVAHFGRHSGFIGESVRHAYTELLRTPDPPALVLLGGNGDRLRDQVRAAAPRHASRVQATGYLSAADLAAHIAGADLMLQPFPDGISSRRGSAMAGLALGRAMVTNPGHLTEPLWAESDAVRLVPLGPPAALGAALAAAATDLLAHDDARQALGQRAWQYYRARFNIERFVAKLHAGPRSCES